MFGLEDDEFAVLVGASYLVLRVLAGASRVIGCYVVDSPYSIAARIWPQLLTGVMVALLAVGLLSMATGGIPQPFRVFAYLATAFLGSVLGGTFDLALDVQFYFVSTWLTATRIPQYRERLLHGDEVVRLDAAKRLSSLGCRALPARPELLAAITDESAEVRAAVSLALLVAVPDPPDDDVEVPKAARVLLSDRALPVRVHAAGILVAYGAPPAKVLPVLCDGLKCEDANVSGLASRALGELGPAAESAIPALRESLLLPDQPNPEAIDALVRIGAPAIPVLIEALDRGDSTVKWGVVRALGNMGEPARAALPALRRLSIQRTMLTAEVKKAIRKLGGDVA